MITLKDVEERDVTRLLVKCTTFWRGRKTKEKVSPISLCGHVKAILLFASVDKGNH